MVRAPLVNVGTVNISFSVARDNKDALSRARSQRCKSALFDTRLPDANSLSATESGAHSQPLPFGLYPSAKSGSSRVPARYVLAMPSGPKISFSRKASKGKPDSLD